MTYETMKRPLKSELEAQLTGATALLERVRRAWYLHNWSELSALLDRTPVAVAPSQPAHAEGEAKAPGIVPTAPAPGVCTPAERADTCWHCLDCLEPVVRPRCERCPDECDDENCTAEGCVESRNTP